MPSVTVDCRVSGGRGLERAIDRADDAEGLLMLAGHEIIAGGEDAFAQEGPGWVGLAERTQNERAALGFGPAGPILFRTGAYRRAMRGTIDADTFRLVNDDPRFDALQHGDPARHLPARPIRVAAVYQQRAMLAMWRAIIR